MIGETFRSRETIETWDPGTEEGKSWAIGTG